MTVARDPCFWRRFSLAVHLDEEAKGSTEKNESSIFSYAFVPDMISPGKQALAGLDLLNASTTTFTDQRTGIPG
ncbi:hypothetical protein PHISP_02859 [Aspergillus sp. HF37]|nr:hypothetical protein PHISP_02859 [Aspergillus sp. HF37]